MPFLSRTSIHAAVHPVAFDFHPSGAMQSKPDKSLAAIHGSIAVPHLKFMKKRLAMLLVVSGLAVCAATVTQAAVPGIIISDATVTEGNSGTTNALFIVSLSPPSVQTITVNYATANTTATLADNDYQ